MESNKNIYLEIAYELFVPNEEGNWDLVEKTSKGNPFQFITGLGFALPAFEKQVISLKDGDTFDFIIPVEDAYGEYTDEHVIELPKDIFCVNGKFDETRIYPGNVIPLANADGNRFDGIVQEVRDNVVVMDLNHPLAGKELHFRGSVLTSRVATANELQAFVTKMNGEEDCECCSHHESGCCGHHEGENCCSHHHEESHHCHHHEGGCCGHHNE